MNDTFPKNLPSDKIRLVKPDPDGRDQNEDNRIFRYIGQRGLFDSPAAFEQMIEGDPETRTPACVPKNPAGRA
ncbi:MAG: hypothetical protein AAF066_17815 [Pseudomonadota bacterium]